MSLKTFVIEGSHTIKEVAAMIENMTAENDNESKQLSFPIQISDEIDDQQSDDSLAAEMRARIVMQLDKVTRGEDVMDQELIDWINRVNALLVRGNYDPVPVDFRKFGVDQNSKPCLVNSTNT